jgi:serine/threonine protein kinase
MGDEDRRIVGRYRLVERIGSGSMGVVWRGLDEKLRRPVAVKQLLPQSGMTDGAAEACARARREGRIAARLHHPNVVSVYDVVEEGGLPWLIMEYVPSRSLATVLARQGRLPLPDVARIGAHIAAALAEAHRAGVVHRDIKPGNVLLTDDGVAKLADFGISRAVGDIVLTVTGLVLGTPAYLAPEVANGDTPTSASDMFALGATLYAAIEGQPPFGTGDNPLAVLHAVASGRYQPPTYAGPLADVLAALLRTDPAQRPRSADIAADLAELARSVAQPMDADTEHLAAAAGPAQAVGPKKKVHSGLPAPYRTITLTLIASAIAITLVATGAAAFLRGQHNTAPAATVPPPHSVTAVPTSTPSVSPSANDPRALITRYYSLLPGHLTEAWQLLSAAYQAKVGGFGSFQGFYATIASVRVRAVTLTGTNTAIATLVFTRKDGTTSVEDYRFTTMGRGTSLVIEDANPTPRTAQGG